MRTTAGCATFALFLSLVATACGPSQPPAASPAGEAPSTGAAAAPGHGEDHAHGPAQGGHASHDMAKMCPMAVEGTTAKAEDAAGGAAIAFTTTGDVAELRRRIGAMAEKHNDAHAAGHSCMMHGDTPMPAASARAEDIEGGARLSFTPKDPAALEDVRTHVRRHAELMASGGCPMMKGGKHGSGGHGDHAH